MNRKKRKKIEKIPGERKERRNLKHSHKHCRRQSPFPLHDDIFGILYVGPLLQILSANSRAKPSCHPTYPEFQ